MKYGWDKRASGNEVGEDENRRRIRYAHAKDEQEAA
jgi:hypothetical protein